VAPDELGKAHALGIDASGPTSEVVFRPVRITFTVPPQNDPSQSGYIHIVSDMDNVSFPVEGEYMFGVSINGEQLGGVAVRAQLGGTVSEEAEAGALLMDGYRAFNRGETAGAEAIFRDVVARFPRIAGGHNNLGFVLLAKGDAEDALEAFTEATRLGYTQSEITTANMACAVYLMGEAKAALDLFEHCLQREIFRSRATLFGINGRRLFPVELGSAADYVALMQLNAAWSAAQAKDLHKAAEYIRAVSITELARRPDAGGKEMADSIVAGRKLIS